MLEMTKEEAIKMFLDDGAAELSVKAEQGGGASRRNFAEKFINWDGW